MPACGHESRQHFPQGRMRLAGAHREVQLCNAFPVPLGLEALTDLFLPLRKTQSIVKSEF